MYYPSKQPPVNLCRSSSRLMPKALHTLSIRSSVMLNPSLWTTSGLSILKKFSNKTRFFKHKVFITVSCLMVPLSANIVIGRVSSVHGIIWRICYANLGKNRSKRRNGSLLKRKKYASEPILFPISWFIAAFTASFL